MDLIKFREYISLELRRIRENKGYTIKQVSDKTGCSTMLISRYENGKPIFIEVLLVLLNFYCVTPDIFFKNVYAYAYNLDNAESVENNYESK